MGELRECLGLQTGATQYHGQLKFQISRQRSWNQRVGCLLLYVFSVAKFNDLWEGSLDTGQARGLVPCCGQDSYRAQLPQHPQRFI